MPSSRPSALVKFCSYCCDLVMLVVFAENVPCIELILGLTSHFSSDWIKKHNISITGGPPQTIKLFEICENWPPHANITKGCPDIAYEYGFIGMLCISIVLPAILVCIQIGIAQFNELDMTEPMCGPGAAVIITNLGLLISAILFIISGRQSGKIIGKEVEILDGPYNLQDTLKIVTGSLVIILFTIRMIVVFIPFTPRSQSQSHQATATAAGRNIGNSVAPARVDPDNCGSKGKGTNTSKNRNAKQTSRGGSDASASSIGNNNDNNNNPFCKSNV